MRKIKEIPTSGEPNLSNSSDSREDDKGFSLKNFLIVVFFLIIVYKLKDVIFDIYQSFTGNVSKDSFRKKYLVDAKTFNKWVEIFCSSEIDFEEYKRCRKLQNRTCRKIESILGVRSDDMPTMSKSDIIQAADGSYELLRQAISEFPEYFNMTPEVFKSLNYFPPKIARHILMGYRDGVQSLNSFDFEIFETKMLSRKV